MTHDGIVGLVDPIPISIYFVDIKRVVLRMDAIAGMAAGTESSMVGWGERPLDT